MTLSLIAAMDKNGGIGFANTIPWMGKLPCDMKHFRELTTGHPIIMGRKTYLSLGKALPRRTNIVLSRDRGFTPEDAEVAQSLEDALKSARGLPGDNEIFIIGGAELFARAIDCVDKMYLTFIDAEFPADKYFPIHFPITSERHWGFRQEESLPPDEKNAYAVRFVTVEKIPAP